MKKVQRSKPKTIAPKLASGEPREMMWMSMPDEFKDAFRDIAKMENKSVSWVCQVVLIEFAHRTLGLPKPEYRRSSPKRHLSLIRSQTRRHA